MATVKLEPTFLNAFKDPRFLLTIAAILMTGGTAYYRLGQVEENQDAASTDLTQFKGEIQKELRERREVVDARLRGVEGQLREPRYTLADDEKRMQIYAESQQRETARTQEWIDEQNKFRLQMVEFASETKAATREFRGLIEDLKKSKTN